MPAVFKNTVANPNRPLVAVFPMSSIERAARDGPGTGLQTIEARYAGDTPDGYLLLGGPYPTLDALKGDAGAQVHAVADATVRMARTLTDAGHMPEWVLGYMEGIKTQTPIGTLVGEHFGDYMQ